MRVEASYLADGIDPLLDDALFRAAGRISDDAGIDLGTNWRDHGWICDTEEDADRIAASLRQVSRDAPSFNITVERKP